MSHLPTFIVIGAPKAGTTALYHYLRAHPGVYMSPVKETLFFRYAPDERSEGLPETLTKGTIRSLEAYQALFEHRTDEQAAGEASPQYFHSPLAAKNIQAHLPHAQIVAILRHPVDRAYSHYMMHMNAGRAPYRDFETFFREARSRLEAWYEMPYDGYGLARSFYYEGLARYYRCFSPAQIRVYRYDDLTTQPVALLADLYGFLGVDATFKPDLSARHNVGGGVPRKQRLHRLLVGNTRVKAPVKRFLAKVWLPSLSRFLLRQTRRPKQDLPPSVRNEFFDVYRADVLQTQELTGVDLSGWLPQ